MRLMIIYDGLMSQHLLKQLGSARARRELFLVSVFGVTSETQTKHFYDISQISPCDIAA